MDQKKLNFKSIALFLLLKKTMAAINVNLGRGEQFDQPVLLNSTYAAEQESEYEALPKRQLVTYLSDVKSSKVCREECINKTYNFCPTNAEFTSGTCCTDKICAGKVDICSNEASSLEGMKMQACPKEPWCGNYYLTPPSNGTKLEVNPFGDYKFIYNNGAMCTYQAVFPLNAGPGDKLRVNLITSLRVESQFMVGLNYGSNKYQHAPMVPGTDMSIGFPYKIYMNLVSTGLNDQEPSDFRFHVQYDKYDPAANGGRPPPTNVVIQNNTITTQIIQKDLWESQDFRIIMGIALIALVFIIILIIALYRLKIKGEKMSKVERLIKQGQTSQMDMLNTGLSVHGAAPASRPNFGGDDSEDGGNHMQKAQSSAISGLFKSEQDQAQFMEFFKKLQAQQNQPKAQIHPGYSNVAPQASLQQYDTKNKVQPDGYPVLQGGSSQQYNYNSQNDGLDDVESMDGGQDPQDKVHDLGNNNDMMGGNNMLAEARREAARNGYVQQSGIQSYNAPTGLGGGLGVGGSKLPPLQGLKKNTQLPALR